MNRPDGTHTSLDVDALANEIRRVDGSHSLGAGALAEALAPYIAALSTPHAEGMVLVPKELSEPMFRAFVEAPAYDHDARKELQAAWDAMIAATPTGGASR